MTYIDFKKVNLKEPKKLKFNKKDLKVYLDNLIKNCSVIELMEKDYREINEVLPEGVSIECLNKWSMKKYKCLKYK